MNILPVTYHSLGKYSDAQKIELNVLDKRNRLLGEEHPDAINAMENLAVTVYHLQRFKDATRLEVQVVDVGKKTFGEEHPQIVKAVALLAEIRSQVNTKLQELKLKKRASLIYSRVWLIHILITLAHYLFEIASTFSKIFKRKLLQYSNISQIINSYSDFQ